MLIANAVRGMFSGKGGMSLLEKINASRTFETVQFSDFLIEVKEPLRCGIRPRYFVSGSASPGYETWYHEWIYYGVYVINKRFAVIGSSSVATDYHDYFEYIDDISSGSYPLLYSDTREFLGTANLNFQPKNNGYLPRIGITYNGRRTYREEYSNPADNRTDVSDFGSSAVIDGSGFNICTDMSESEIKQMIKNFAIAANKV